MVSAFETAATTSEYAKMARRPLQPEQCALVVIDIQEKLLPPIFQKEQLVQNAQLLIRAATILNIPTLASTQYAKGLGATVPEIASLLAGTEAIDKTLFSCFGSEAFCSVLKRLPGQRNTLLLCGMESHICVTQTAWVRCARDTSSTSRPTRSVRGRSGIGRSGWNVCRRQARLSRRPR
jgi:isochorismate hydrolase